MKTNKFLTLFTYFIIGVLTLNSTFEFSLINASLTVAALMFAMTFVSAPKGALFIGIAKTTEFASIVNWAGQYNKTLFKSMLNGLDVFKDLKVDMAVSDHGKLLPKLTVEAGMRPLDTSVDENGRVERTVDGRMLEIHQCMKLFKYIPTDVIGSYQSDMYNTGDTKMPIGQYYWAAEMEKLGSEINDNFYKSEFHADAAAFNPASAYAVGDYVFYTDKNFYKCVTITSAGETPISHPAKWLLANGIVCFDGPAKVIADAIVSDGLVPVTTGAISTSNAMDAMETMYKGMSVARRSKGGVVRVSYDVYEKYLEQERSEYTAALNPEFGDGKKYIYGSSRKWEIRPATWMVDSQRIIFDIEGKHLWAGSNTATVPGITNVEPKLHYALFLSSFDLGFQIADLEGIEVNNQA